MSRVEQPLISGSIADPNFLVKQGKVSKEIDPKHYVLTVLYLLIGVPIFLFVFVPAAVITHIVKKYIKPPAKDESPKQDAFPVFEATGKIPPQDREFDLVLYGATGFTGKLAVEYVIKNYGTTIKYAIAGRNLNALERVRDDILAQLPDKADELKKHVKILVGDSTKPETLRPIVNSTRVICTTAGPFDKYGTPLVALCAAYGTHICDITGETDWVRKLIDNYEKQAKESGAMIVNFCGHDCAPWDLTVYKCSELLETKYNQHMKSVKVYDEVSGAISGGTLATILHSLIGRLPYKSRLGFDPLLSKHGERQTSELRTIPQHFLSFDSYINKFVGPFVMAAVMGNCIRRSNAINGYSGPGQKLSYHEVLVYNSIWEAIPDFIGLAFLGVSFFIPFLPDLLSKLLPPGSGPSEETMKKGYLRLTAIATGTEGAKVQATMYFKQDPGYRDTARMLVEAGLTILFHKDAITKDGGVWTPASALKQPLLDRLVKTGCQFEIKPISSA